MEGISDRKFNNNHYPYRINIRFEPDDTIIHIIKLHTWLLNNVGCCERLPRVFLRILGINETDTIQEFTENNPPQWAAKYYHNGRIKVFFHDPKKAMLFKLSWSNWLV